MSQAAKESLQIVAHADAVYWVMQVGIGSDGQPELFAPPVAQLASDFPLQPTLLGNLVPHQVNLWMGAAPSGETPCHLLNATCRHCCNTNIED